MVFCWSCDGFPLKYYKKICQVSSLSVPMDRYSVLLTAPYQIVGQYLQKSSILSLFSPRIDYFCKIIWNLPSDPVHSVLGLYFFLKHRKSF